MSEGTTDMVQCLRGPMDGATVHASEIRRGKIRKFIAKKLRDHPMHDENRMLVWEWCDGKSNADAIAVYSLDKATGHLYHVRMEDPK